METNLTLLYEKIDSLSNKVDELNGRFDRLENRNESLVFGQQSIMLNNIHDKLAALIAGQEDLGEMRTDLAKLAIINVGDLNGDFDHEQFKYLIQRVAGDLSIFTKILDQIESLIGFKSEVDILGKQVFNNLVENLDRYERNGYFSFIQSGLQVLERIVTEFDEEDVKALGDNIVTILTTVRSMTQPDILAIANNAIGAISEDTYEQDSVSIWEMIKEFKDPEVRSGMIKMLNLIKSLA